MTDKPQMSESQKPRRSAGPAQFRAGGQLPSQHTQCLRDSFLHVDGWRRRTPCSRPRAVCGGQDAGKDSSGGPSLALRPGYPLGCARTAPPSPSRAATGARAPKSIARGSTRGSSWLPAVAESPLVCIDDVAVCFYSGQVHGLRAHTATKALYSGSIAANQHHCLHPRTLSRQSMRTCQIPGYRRPALRTCRRPRARSAGDAAPGARPRQAQAPDLTKILFTLGRGRVRA